MVVRRRAKRGSTARRADSASTSNVNAAPARVPSGQGNPLIGGDHEAAGRRPTSGVLCNVLWSTLEDPPMPMRVSELVHDPALGLRVVVGGDLERTVRWVHTTELTDPSRYLQGGEVILTTGVWMAAGTSAPAFVRPLARAGVAALGYGLPAPDAETPPALVDACADGELTLFSVPFELPFIAIAERFVERLTADRQQA